MPAFATSSRLLDTITDLYDSTACCPDLDAHAAAQNVDPKERKLFEALAKARHANPEQSREETLKSKEWKDLYKYVSAELMGGAEKGYGKELVKLDFDTPDHRMLSKLSENLHWFSANKNWQLLVDVNAQLKTTDGKLREWADFKREALRLDKQYNTVWLRTEYNAAVASSQMAGKWVGFEERQDETYLRYDTAGDRRVRPAHVQLDGITLPATDIFWQSYFPPLDWNCRCDVTEVLRSRATPTDLQQRGPLPQIAEGFKSNVGKSGQVFDETHPYFGGVPQSEQKILQEVVQAELRSEFEPKDLEETYGVRLPKKFFDNIGHEVTIKVVDNSGSQYNFKQQEISFSKQWAGFNRTPLLTKSSMVHELGHAYHYSTGLVTYARVDARVKSLYDKCVAHLKDAPAASRKYFPNKADNLKQLQKKYPAYSEAEVLRLWMGTTDVVSALSQGKRGFGHLPSYWNKHPHIPYMELMAHTADVNFNGNEIFKDLLPEIYQEFLQFWSDELK